MSEAVTVIDGGHGLGPRERLHPLFLVTGLGKTLRGAWGLAVGGIWLATSNRAGYAALILLGYIALSLAGLFFRWLKLEYRVGADELRIDSGFLNKKSRAIPFDRVTDIDIEQGPVHRLLGLARVRLETGASAGGEEDGVLDTVSLARAEALREHVRARRLSPTADSQTVEAAEDGEAIYAMNGRRVLLAGLFNFSLAIVAGLFGASQTVGNVVGFDPFKRSFWERVLAESGPLRELMLAHQILSVVGGAIVLTLLGIGTGLVRTLLREHGFRLDRTESGFRRRRGLLTLTDVTIPARRVQAAILATGPIRRRFGWWTLKFQSLAQDGRESDHVVAPLATLDEAAAIEARIDLPVQPAEGDWKPIAFGFVSSAVLPLGVMAIISALIGLMAQPAMLITAGGFAVAGVLRWSQWRNARYALDSDHLFIERGWWRHQRLVLPLRRIQSVDLNESFWTRWFDYCAINLGVAGGTMLAVHGIPALSRVDAEAVRAQLLRP